MKITFICGSLQTGSDGVGDYVRRLACELIANGHQVNAIALKDQYIQAVEQTVQEFEGIKLKVLRLPASLPAATCYNHLGDNIRAFNPELVSLQYVGFGFQKYGLPFDILFNLRKAIGQTRLHIMLHELWCGMAVNAGLKEKLLGKAQKLFLKVLIGVLKPETIFTSIEPYHVFLKQINVDAKVVPIFGNIPVNELGKPAEWENLVTRIALSALTLAPQNWLVIGFFGTTYNCPGLAGLLHTAHLAAQTAGLKLGVLAIGHSRGQNVGNLVKNMPGIAYWQTGPLSPGMINRNMQLVNIGVVTSPVDGINKSGSAIAWMERGIPVLISAKDKTYFDTMVNQGVYQARSANEVLTAYYAKSTLQPQSNLKKVASAYAV